MATAKAEQTQTKDAKPGDPLYTLLVKLGVNPAGAAKLGPQEAHNKIVFRVTKQGIPEDLTADERAIVIGLGFSENGKPPAKPEPESEKLVPYRKAGLPGQPDRVEAISAKTARSRNMRSSDGRKWEPAPEGTLLTEAVTKTPNKTATTPKETKAADETAGKTATAAKAPSGEKGDETVATTTKNKKATKAKGRATANATTKTDPDKGGKKTGGKNNRVGAADAFRAFFKDGSKVEKKKVIDKLSAMGMKPASAASYIVWAKRTEKGSADHANPWGFVLEESKDDKGVKFLRKVKTIS